MSVTSKRETQAFVRLHTKEVAPLVPYDTGLSCCLSAFRTGRQPSHGGRECDLAPTPAAGFPSPALLFHLSSLHAQPLTGSPIPRTQPCPCHLFHARSRADASSVVPLTEDPTLCYLFSQSCISRVRRLPLFV